MTVTTSKICWLFSLVAFAAPFLCAPNFTRYRFSLNCASSLTKDNNDFVAMFVNTHKQCAADTTHQYPFVDCTSDPPQNWSLLTKKNAAAHGHECCLASWPPMIFVVPFDFTSFICKSDGADR